MDPGHFLLGAFERLAEQHLSKDQVSGRRTAAARSLDAVFGVDINPFAASIARFRLLAAALRFANVSTLTEAPNFRINVAVGDSLFHGPHPGRLRRVLETTERQSETTRHLYETEDATLVERFLSQKYHAVVANPPYITPKDPAVNNAYRERYRTCYRKYSLAVPFMERLFDLALRGTTLHAGYVGQITTNSFMKREFGKKLVQEYLASHIDLTDVIDTSGAYIPGHSTPTVLLIGRNRLPVGDQVRAVLGIRGEPITPANPALGHVWLSVIDLIDQPGAENHYVSVANIDRVLLASHPWSLRGGVARPLKNLIESHSTYRLDKLQDSIGVGGISGVDEVYVDKYQSLINRAGIEKHIVRRLVVGDRVRDWYLTNLPDVVFPYHGSGLIDIHEIPGLYRRLWPFRTIMGERRTFRKTSYFEEGRPWWGWHQVALKRIRVPYSIAFAFVATHNHFVLDRGDKVFQANSASYQTTTRC